jgi:hypothetical protein
MKDMIQNERDFAIALDRYITKEQDDIDCPNLRALDYASKNELTTCICILDCRVCENQCQDGYNGFDRCKKTITLFTVQQEKFIDRTYRR